ncbi:MAG: hypothetical protein U5J63_14930 [Fodinibius sp.]|nr:hypothetical protein [Fodinibius sp.]
MLYLQLEGEAFTEFELQSQPADSHQHKNTTWRNKNSYSHPSEAPLIEGSTYMATRTTGLQHLAAMQCLRRPMTLWGPSAHYHPMIANMMMRVASPPVQITSWEPYDII